MRRFSFHSFIFDKGVPGLSVYGITLIFCFSSMFCFAQKTYSSSDLLRLKRTTASNALLQNNISFLKNNNQKMSLVSQLEIRTETDEFDFQRQEFLFRSSFNGKQSRKVQNQLIENKERLYELKDELLDASALVDRYEYIVDWHFSEKEINYLKAKKELLEDKKTVYQKMLANSDFVEIDNLLKTEEALQEIDQLVLQNQQDKNFAIQQLFATQNLSDSLTLSTDNWISLIQMKEVLAKTEILPATNLNQTLQASKVRNARLEYDREKAKGQKIVDFVQVKYAGRDKLGFEKEWSVGLGINIPTRFANRVKLNEAQLDIFDEQFKQQLLQESLSEKIETREAQFIALLENHELLKQQIEESALATTFKNFAKAGEVHPLSLLRIKEVLLKNESKLQRLEREACLVFVEILELKGFLTQVPSINYLSDNLQSF